MRKMRIIVGAVAIAACLGAAALVISNDHRDSHTGARPSSGTGTASHPTPAGRPAELSLPPTATDVPSRPAAFAVGLRELQLVDTSRTIRLPNGSVEPRTLRTIVRYPALGSPNGTDLRNAPAARLDGPFPLVIFGHGFSVTPGLYAHLLQAWTRAGYVVAAPVFPLGNANAPGGPNESDLPNQPADMRFVISSLLAISSAPSGPLAGLVNPKAIAASGHSDGGDTALTVAYDEYDRDSRIKAAAILSGAEIPGMGGYSFPPGSPPLLATQGTADPINTPAETELFFKAARRPKYLLRLLGAEHLPPYHDEQPQLGVIERVTIAFYDAYLKHEPGALRHLVAAGRVGGVASLAGYPRVR